MRQKPSLRRSLSITGRKPQLDENPRQYTLRNVRLKKKRETKIRKKPEKYGNTETEEKRISTRSEQSVQRTTNIWPPVLLTL